MTRRDRPKKFRPHDVFVRALVSRGLKLLSQTEDGRYVVESHGNELTVNLDNVARNALRDEDPGVIERFVDSLLESTRPLPLWPEARAGIRYTLEAPIREVPGIIHDAITDELWRVMSWIAPDEGSSRWLCDEDVRTLRVEPEALMQAADANMETLLRSAKLQIQEIDSTPLGFFETASPFKSSLILAPSLEDAVRGALGWPVCAVVPCRDFLYLFPDGCDEFIPRLGSVVVREYQDSGYPLTTQVLRLSDEGIEAVGKFATQ